MRERAERAMMLKRSGLTFEQVAEACGYQNKSNAYRAIAGALKRIGVAEAVEYKADLDAHRIAELAKLDEKEEALRPAILLGDTKAIEAGLKCQTRRAKMLGLDAVQKVAVEHDVSSGLAGLFAQLERRDPVA